MDNLLFVEGVEAGFGEGGVEFSLKPVEFGEVVGGGADDAGFFVGSAAFAGPGAGAHGFFDALFPMGFFAPAGEAEVGGEAAGEVDGFAGGVPGEVQVGGEMDICFKYITVDFDAVRVVVFF